MHDVKHHDDERLIQNLLISFYRPKMRLHIRRFGHSWPIK